MDLGWSECAQICRSERLIIYWSEGGQVHRCNRWVIEWSDGGQVLWSSRLEKIYKNRRLDIEWSEDGQVYRSSHLGIEIQKMDKCTEVATWALKIREWTSVQK